MHHSIYVHNISSTFMLLAREDTTEASCSTDDNGGKKAMKSLKM